MREPITSGGWIRSGKSFCPAGWSAPKHHSIGNDVTFPLHPNVGAIAIPFVAEIAGGGHRHRHTLFKQDVALPGPGGYPDTGIPWPLTNHAEGALLNQRLPCGPAGQIPRGIERLTSPLGTAGHVFWAAGRGALNKILSGGPASNPRTRRAYVAPALGSGHAAAPMLQRRARTQYADPGITRGRSATEVQAPTLLQVDLPVIRPPRQAVGIFRGTQ